MTGADFELVEFTASEIVVRHIPFGHEFIFDIIADESGAFTLADRPEVGEVASTPAAAAELYDEARSFATAEAEALGILRSHS